MSKDNQIIAGRIVERIDELAAISEQGDCITRTYGTPAFIEARNKLQHWMKMAGLAVTVDNIGNIRGRMISTVPGAKTFVIGSHIDTIINAGKWDGPLGVLMGLEIIEQLKDEKVELPFHLELIGFCDEEGCRFHTTYLGSRVVAGSFNKELLDAKDASGATLLNVMEENHGIPDNLPADAIPKEQWAGYFEIHIEQGPVLFNKNIPVGLVTAIAGQYRVGIKFTGEPGHAGTVPMNMRRDALAAASEFVLAIERYANDPSMRENRAASIVATVGKLHVVNAASNVIPGEVVTSLDLRSSDAAELKFAYSGIQKLAEDICRQRNIRLEWEIVQQSSPVACDERMNKLIARSISESGYEMLSLVSGAGHDAVPVSEVAPVSMLFVKCFKGISHSPLENVESNDIEAAMQVANSFIRLLMEDSQPSARPFA
jgi:hydantoinase/carbamoylase family amidase